jgi:hypothetical protein
MSSYQEPFFPSLSFPPKSFVHINFLTARGLLSGFLTVPDFPLFGDPEEKERLQQCWKDDKNA